MQTSTLTADSSADRSAELSARLADRLDEFDLPGAAFAFARGDELVQGAAGVLSRTTGLAATPDSWFQIGSITKLFTGTMVMQLVDDGLVDLDQPVRGYLPDFDAGDEAASSSITVRQLLTHTSGLQGDYFADFGRGSDAVRRYVHSLADVGMLHEPGSRFSYCNSGFSVLGLLLETLRGNDFDSILTERLLRPLGIAGGTLAEQAMLHRAAVGHVDGPDGSPVVPAGAWAIPYSAGPAGATPFMSPAGLVSFVRMHLAGGLATDGTRVLSEESVAAMQRMQVALPDRWPVRGIGMPWALYPWGDSTVLGHDGGTLGQYSFLRVHPDTGAIAVLLTNGPGGAAVFRRFGQPLFAELTGLTEPEPLVPPENPPAVDVRPLVGRYAHHGVTIDLGVGGESPAMDDRAAATVTTVPEPNQALGEGGESQVRSLVPLYQDGSALALISAEPEHGSYLPVLADLSAAGLTPDGHPRHLLLGSRVFARTSG
ncbi:serine hydrolase domain-containing protein [Nakamurella lactea]|uniref:serine hydrolase domain-containing protein n=1 Tax=Nakamurella lactea TaxID=459515 RepID=UPI000685F4A3|nr:serine hydrolase domain-containing protein [Nakamurella lactea]